MSRTSAAFGGMKVRRQNQPARNLVACAVSATDFCEMRLLLPALFAALLPFRTSAAADTAPRAEPNILTISTDKLLADALYRQPKKLVDEIAPSGAVGVNGKFEKKAATEWFIEQQRGGADLVQAGVILKNETLIKEGVRILNWGFARQGPDGDFPGTGDPLHSTSFFVEATARAALLLQLSKSPHWQPQVAEWTPKIKAAARWMIRPDVAQKGRANNLLPYTHRFHLRAAALGLAAAVTGERDFADAAAAYAAEGLTHQQPDGVNPEKDGFDVSYQVVGVTFALRYLTVCADETLRGKIREMSRKAIDNALTMVGRDGSISLEGSTRAGQEKSRSGKTKTIDHKSFLEGVIFAEKILGEPRYRAAAQSIAAHK